MDTSNNTNRKYYRWHFQSGEIPLVYQTTGVSIRLYKRFLFFDFFVAQAVIKDISIGGVGFISKHNLDKKLVMQLPNGEKIPCKIEHVFQVNNKLNFYGASWDKYIHKKVLPLLKIYSKVAYRSREDEPEKVTKIHKS